MADDLEGTVNLKHEGVEPEPATFIALLDNGQGLVFRGTTETYVDLIVLDDHDITGFSGDLVRITDRQGKTVYSVPEGTVPMAVKWKHVIGIIG